MNIESEKTYPPSLVVQQNKLLEAWYSMTLNEKRIFLVASPMVRCQQIQEGQDIIIRAEDFALAAGIHINSAYEGLAEACKKLFKRSFSYINERNNRVDCRWTYRLEYNKSKGEICLAFPKEVLFMLTVFGKDNPYTVIDQSMALKFRGMYSLRLYMLLKQYDGTIGKRIIGLDELRRMFVFDNKYKILANLRLRVIEPALEEINEISDIRVTYRQVKQGREVTGFEFEISAKKTPKNITTLLSQQDVKKNKKSPPWDKLHEMELESCRKLHPTLTQKDVEGMSAKYKINTLQIMQKIKLSDSSSFEMEFST